MSDATSGPWFAEKSTAGFWWVTSDPEPYAPIVAQVFSHALTPEQQEAAAHILSAAPELLAALKLAKRICEDAFKDTGMEWDEAAMSAIDAAIAKATAHLETT